MNATNNCITNGKWTALNDSNVGNHAVNGFETLPNYSTHIAAKTNNNSADDVIQTKYEERFTMFNESKHGYKNMVREHIIETSKRVPKLGVMLVGLGGNNGSTFVAGIMANKKKLSWETKQGQASANFYGSFTQSATVHAGY